MLWITKMIVITNVKPGRGFGRSPYTDEMEKDCIVDVKQIMFDEVQYWRTEIEIHPKTTQRTVTWTVAV